MNIEIDEIVEKYSNMIMQIAFQNVFNKTDAEDITQEVFIKIMRNISIFQNEEHMKAWIIRVTINLSKDYNKNFWNKNTIGLDEEIKCFGEEYKDIFEEISKLKPKYRNIIYLYYYQGYKINEIAEILLMNQNTVSSYLIRARRELKDILEDGGEMYA